MSEGYARAALRLSELPADDRSWLLERLSEPDRRNLAGLVERILDTDKAPPAPAPSAAQDPVGAELLVERASALRVAEALRGEPEWLVALLLARRDWPWARDLVDGFEPDRVSRLRALAHGVDASAGRRVFDAAVAALAHKLESIAPELARPNAFDALVARLAGTLLEGRR
jgi:hypothetical protein